MMNFLSRLFVCFFLAGAISGLVISVVLFFFVGKEHMATVLGIDFTVVAVTPLLTGLTAGLLSQVFQGSGFGVLRGVGVAVVSFVMVCGILAIISGEIFRFFGYLLFGGILFGWIVVIAGGTAGWLQKRTEGMRKHR